MLDQLIDIDVSDDVLEGLRYPVVLKAVSADLPHKSELGAVRINLQNAQQLRGAIEVMRNSIAKVLPELEVEQLLVIASGGVLVELTRDAKALLLPAGSDRIRAALEALEYFKLLQGFRGRTGADIEMLVDRIHALARFAEAHQATLLEMDINPLMVTPDQCIVADIMIREIPR